VTSAVVEVTDLVKVYRGGTRAVDGISFGVERGAFLGFLGPNGAGKTTTIRILTTLLKPTSGSARVVGLDVVADAGAVRGRIGLAMQTVAIDALSTGRENLELIGRLHRMAGHDLRQRVDELLALMGLAEVGGQLAGSYSGGMKRRLDLASALVHRPEVLFLDEPTEGLDPQSRTALWEELERINQAGTTMILTTHYMEEADRLSTSIAIIDGGRIAVEGRAAELKRAIGADSVMIRLAPGSDGHDRAATDGLVDAQDAVARLMTDYKPLAGLERTPFGVVLAVNDAEGSIPEVLRRLDGAGIRVTGLSMASPTLDDVFLRYTGRRIRTEAADQPISLGW
jgi:ABC-2 type transport system ATP-binding protein